MKEKLLDAAQLLAQDKGLQSVSFQDLANAVGLRKPSVFHHFKNREELVSGLMDRCRTSYGSRYTDVIESDLSPIEKLHGLADVFGAELKGDKMCLLATLANSAASLPDPSKEELKSTVAQVVSRYQAVFEQGRADGSLRFSGSPQEAAAAFLAMAQGLQMIARASGNAEMFAPAATSYIDSLAKR